MQFYSLSSLKTKWNHDARYYYLSITNYSNGNRYTHQLLKEEGQGVQRPDNHLILSSVCSTMDIRNTRITRAIPLPRIRAYRSPNLEGVCTLQTHSLVEKQLQNLSISFQSRRLTWAEVWFSRDGLLICSIKNTVCRQLYSKRKNYTKQYH